MRPVPAGSLPRHQQEQQQRSAGNVPDLPAFAARLSTPPLNAECELFDGVQSWPGIGLGHSLTEKVTSTDPTQWHIRIEPLSSTEKQVTEIGVAQNSPDLPQGEEGDKREEYENCLAEDLAVSVNHLHIKAAG